MTDISQTRDTAMSTGQALIAFSFENQQVRVHVDQEGKPWWVLSDCCEVLDIKDPHQVAERLKSQYRCKIPTLASDGKHYPTWCVNESGLYRVIFRSNKEEAEVFQDWIFDEVIPAIHRQGYYSLTGTGLLRALIAPAVQAWERRFSQKFFEEICRVYKKRIPTDDKHSPMCAGFMYRHVYAFLPDEVLEALNTMNPVTNKEKGYRRYRNHQCFNLPVAQRFFLVRETQILSALAQAQPGEIDVFKKALAKNDLQYGIIKNTNPKYRKLIRLLLPEKHQMEFDFSAAEDTEEDAA